MSYTLGIDLGSSSVKTSLLDITSGKCVASITMPDDEMKIDSLQIGYAEQSPYIWYRSTCAAIRKLLAVSGVKKEAISAIGVAYQMHGLVLVNKNLELLRPAIIWCDSRAVPYGEKAAKGIGENICLESLLNLPGNFTASKLAWVKENEPEIYSKIYKIMLPGDWLAMKLTGAVCTTQTGLSEGIFWDYKTNRISDDILNYYRFDKNILCDVVPVFGKQGKITSEVAGNTGLSVGTPVTYRGGDQPNNALSLNVLQPGEVAATAGTSGVVYGVSDKKNYDPQSRVNRFLHVNNSDECTRIGVLLCINGTGILNSWLRNTYDISSYTEMNRLAQQVPCGSEGISVLPFGNGAERMLGNRNTTTVFSGIDLLRHNKAHLCRAVQEGIVFAFRYGMEILEDNGIEIKAIKAGKANMFQSGVFCQTLADINSAKISLYETDGALGSARGAGIGAGIYSNFEDAFSTLQCVEEYTPLKNDACEEAYIKWKNLLDKHLQ